MTRPSWKIGDVVTLKSGGPPMTVSGFHARSNDSVQCMWFAENDRRVEWFHPDSLKLVPASASEEGST